MAIMDEKLELLDGFTLASLTTTQSAMSTVLNLGAADLNIGAGTPLYLNIQTGSIAITGNGTTQFKLYTDSDSTVTGGTLIFETPAIGLSAYTAGQYVLRVPLPVNVDKEQYIGLTMVQATTEGKTGSLDAWLNLAADTDFGLQPSV